MKTATDHLFLLSVIVFVYLLFRSRFPAASFVLLCLYCRWRSHTMLWIAAAVCMLAVSVPHSRTDPPEIRQGRIIEVRESYAIAAAEGWKILLYTDGELPYDALVSFVGQPQEIRSSVSFYGGSFASYCRRRGIRYSMDPESLQIMEERTTFRSWLQKQCAALDPVPAAAARRILLGIGSDSLPDTFLFSHGFSLSALLAAAEGVLKYVLDRRTRRIVMLPLCASAAFLYGFPLVLVQSLLFRILSLTPLTGDRRTGAGFLIVFLLFPEAPFSASFLIPAVYRVSGRFFHGSRAASSAASMLIQNLLFSSTNPLLTVSYIHLRKFIGAVWLLVFLSVVLRLPVLLSAAMAADRLFTVIDSFEIPGSMLGCGLPFFIAAVFAARRPRSAGIRICILFLFFQCTGLFHPFAEITFINVGQGDCILIRAPLGRGNILIDTGKPSALQKVRTMLDAKGIRELEALILTHADDDHSGSRDDIVSLYSPERIIDAHHGTEQICGYSFTDLNPLTDEDENRSSLAEYVRINGLDYFLAGDIDETAEKAILDRYGQLRADILKVAHHGSATASSERFLNTAQPRLAVISSGSYELYHHPSEDVVQRLLRRHIPYLDTKTEGDITILCISRWNVLITSSGKFALISS